MLSTWPGSFHVAVEGDVGGGDYFAWHAARLLGSPQTRALKVATPSPLRSASAALRPVIARISDAAGPHTSGPPPALQPTAAAPRRSPTLRCLTRRSGADPRGKTATANTAPG